MQFGVYGGREIWAAVKAARYDFLEWSVGDLLRPREDEDVFHEALEEMRQAGLPCPAVNRLLPADLKVVGPAVNGDAVKAYLTTTFDRAREAGVKVLVFGSGGARAVPAGFDRGQARDQLVAFCGMAGNLAQARDLCLVVEPLNRKESNILNTVSESADLVRQVNHPNVRLLVDAYHWAKERETSDGIVKNGDLLRHVHIATVQNRLAPGAEPQDMGVFFEALKEAKYAGRLSIEATIRNPEVDLPRALEMMKTLSQT